MTYTVCNAVTHSVTSVVRNDGRTTVQNQNQNQTLYKALGGSSVANQVQIATAVTREAAAIGFGANE